jgi:hypothetical protein
MASPAHNNLSLWQDAWLAGWRYPAARSALFRDPMLLTNATPIGAAIAVAIPIVTGNAGRWGH